MIASVSPTVSPPAAPTKAYSQQLAVARDRLAYVTGAPFDTPQRVDFGLANLHSAASSVHDALAGAGKVDTALPSGVVHFPREAAASIGAAIAELGRGTTGHSVDVAAVHSDASSALGKLQLAIGLIAHPPSTEVFDGS